MSKLSKPQETALRNDLQFADATTIESLVKKGLIEKYYKPGSMVRYQGRMFPLAHFRYTAEGLALSDSLRAAYDGVTPLLTNVKMREVA